MAASDDGPAGDALVMRIQETLCVQEGFFSAISGASESTCGNTSAKVISMKSEVRELLTEELKDAYSAEKQALRCMQRALRKASAEALREGIQMHIEQTQVQIERLEQAMERLSVRPGRKVCEAMRGLVEEAQHEIEEHDEKGPILDLIIVAGMQRIEHYEIAAYGTDVALAEALGEKEVADLLSQTLEEEKQTDLKLTEVTQKAIMPEALAGEEEEEGGGERGGTRSGGRRKAA
jgi:ferritin-like metal-binding protein YciE